MAAKPELSVGPVEESAWDPLLARFPDRTVFHSLAWLRTVAASNGLKIVLAQATRGGTCVSIWPYLELRKGPFRVIGSPLPGWSTAYLGPLFSSEIEPHEAIEAFLQHKLFRRYAYFACKVIDRSRPVDMKPFGFSPVMKFDTYLIDLTQPQETLWGNLKSENRTRIRKAQKLNVEVREETEPGFLDDYWAMSIETFQKSHIQPTHSKQFVHELWKHLRPAGRVYALSGFVEGKRAGTLVLPYDDHTMYYWGGASYQQHRDIPVHNLLHWTAICEAQKRGLKGYDFISTIGNPGRFKKTFGPVAVDMTTHWERSPSRLMSALKNRYERYLKKRRRVDA